MNSIDLTSKLISFDTTSRGSNLALIDFAQDFLEQHGARCRRTHDADRAKANLFATFGPDRRGGYVLSGHTDVVPVDGQDWASDPFRAEIRDDKLFGRGACDMKGFVGTALALVPEIAQASLNRPIHFALSYDEEVGCIGVRDLLADLAAEEIRPALAIVGEPTLMHVVGAHKGGTVVKTRCCGLEGHSSAPHKGANAVMMAGGFVDLLDRIGEELKSDSDPRFDPPSSTIEATMIEGGTAVNILAREALVTWGARTLPGRDAVALVDMIRARANAEVLPKYRARFAHAHFETEIVARYPALAMHEDSPAIALARELSGANRAEAVSYGTEAGHFQNAGIPAVICGPGSIEQAHKTDEYVALSELASCATFLRKVIARACA